MATSARSRRFRLRCALRARLAKAAALEREIVKGEDPAHQQRLEQQHQQEKQRRQRGLALNEILDKFRQGKAADQARSDARVQKGDQHQHDQREQHVLPLQHVQRVLNAEARHLRQLHAPPLRGLIERKDHRADVQHRAEGQRAHQQHQQQKGQRVGEKAGHVFHRQIAVAPRAHDELQRAGKDGQKHHRRRQLVQKLKARQRAQVQPHEPPAFRKSLPHARTSPAM